MSKPLNPSNAQTAGPPQGQVLYSINQASSSLAGVPSSGIKQGPQGQQQNTASQAQASALINQAQKQQQFQQQYQQRMAQQNRVPQPNTAAPSGLYSQQYNFKIPNPGSTGMQSAAGHQMPMNFVNNNAPVFHPPGMNGLSPYDSSLNRQQAMLQQQNGSVSSSSQQDTGPTSMGASNQASQNFHPAAHSLNMGVSSGMIHGPNSFNKFGGAGEMGAQGQMFKNIMLGGGGPQGLMNQMPGDSTSFAPNQFSGGALGSSQMGASGQVGASAVGGSRNANNIQNDMQSNFQLNMQMSGMGLGQAQVDMEPRNVQGMPGGAMRANVSDVQSSMKRKVNSRPGSNPLYVSDIHEPKRFDVLETYEHASAGQNYKSLEFSIFNGGIDTGIEFGELSVANSSLLNHEVVDSVSGEKKSGFAAHSSLASQNLQLDKQKFSDRFLGPFCSSQLNSRKLTEAYPQIHQEFTASSSSGGNTSKISGMSSELSQAEQQQVRLMKQYFNLINTSMHLQINPPSDFSSQSDKQNEQDRLNYIAESESFNHEFLLPKSYDMPMFRDKPAAIQQGADSSPVTPERCKVLPDTILFYIFYSMPFDRAQLNASHELKRRSWFYSDQSMRWMKAAEAQNQSPQHPVGKSGAGKKGRNTSKNQGRNRSSIGGQASANGSSGTRQVIVFNPQIWKEETLSVIED